jgi:uncharacterized SAM-dependent methyltransferase/transposase
MSNNTKNYYKNIEISRKFGVNPTTVTNWIEASKKDKNQLQLVQIKDRDYILKKEHNDIIIENLVQSSKKYKHKSQRKVVKAKPEFFETFTPEEIAEIINGIEIYGEIPHKFTYVSGGAKSWAEYVKRSLEEGINNTVTNTERLLEESKNLILNEFDDGYKINVIDIGCGDIAPVKKFLNYLITKNLLKDYVAYDISQDILDIAEKNIKNWFGDSFKTSYVRRDINYDRVEDLLFYSVHNERPKNSKNLILFLGSTVENQLSYIEPLNNISSKLTENDIFVLGVTLDNIRAKTYLDFAFKKVDKQLFQTWQEFVIPEYFGFEKDDYEVNTFYDEQKHTRFMTLTVLKDIDISIEGDNIDTLLSINKSQQLTVWKHSHHTLPGIINDMDSVGLDVKHVLTSPDETHAMLIAKRKKN